MPGRNGTGPAGLGPGTGWGAGFCSGNRGRGLIRPRFGGGCGHGGRHGFRDRGTGRVVNAPPVSREEEAAFLRGEAVVYEARLKELRERLGALENIPGEPVGQAEVREGDI